MRSRTLQSGQARGRSVEFLSLSCVARKLPHEAWVQVQRSEFHLVMASVNGRERRGARLCFCVRSARHQASRCPARSRDHGRSGRVVFHSADMQHRIHVPALPDRAPPVTALASRRRLVPAVHRADLDRIPGTAEESAASGSRRHLALGPEPAWRAFLARAAGDRADRNHQSGVVRVHRVDGGPPRRP